MGNVSRRGLLAGLFRKPVEAVREKIPDVLRTAMSRAAPARTPARTPAPDRGAGAAPATAERSSPPREAPPTTRANERYPRRLRGPEDQLTAHADASGRYLVNLLVKPLLPGGSFRVNAADLAEPLVLVRVTPTHLACTTGECTLDGSDLRWHAGLDVVWCPGCGSQWRLDGTLARGPAKRRLVSCPVEQLDDTARIDVP